MEELEGFLMQDEEGLEVCIENSFKNVDCLLLDQWWDDEFLSNVREVNSNIDTFILEDQDHEVVFQQELPVVQIEEEHNLSFDQCLPLGKKQEQLQPPRVQEEEEEPTPPPQGRQVLDEDEIEQEDDTESDDRRPDEISSKNLQSERNRRKRLNQQLYTLRSLVPNISKMDKRSILADALLYLQSIIQEIEKEMKRNGHASGSSPSSCSESSSSSVEFDAPPPPPAQLPPYERCAAPPAVLEINVEMLDEERFVLEIGCNKAMGALSQVQRAIEMLGLEITCSSTSDLNQDSMLITAFVRVKRRSIATQGKLLHRLRLNAKQLGLLLPPDS